MVPVITIHDPSVDPDKVIFKTRSGTEFKREKFDKTTGRDVLNLVGRSGALCALPETGWQLL